MRRWPRIAGGNDVDSDPRNSAAQHGGHNEYRQLTGRAAVTVLASTFLILQLGFLVSEIFADSGQRDWWPSRQYSWTDVILAAITLAYMVVSFRQWKVLRDTLNETKRSNALSLRAWLIIDGMELDPRTRTLRNIGDLRITIRNVGKVPAVSVRSMSSTRWDPPDSVAWLRDIDTVDPTIELDIGPGCFTPTVYTFNPPSDAVLSAVHTGETLLTVVARFTYNDVLGSIGETIFSARYLHSVGRFVLAPGGNTVR